MGRDCNFLMIDHLFGPIVFRLFNGLALLDADGAAILAGRD